ncbi:hypothetical protein N665_0357s0012, partial [Sinapis alba]
LKAPPPESWVPNKNHGRGIEGCPGQSNHSFLDVICRFCHVPDSVEFCFPEAEERDDSPPDGYFTCYDTHLLHCRLWFPIPEIIVQVLDRFGLSISQITPASLQHLVGILILSYERGMTLDDDYLEALLMPVASKKSRIYCLKPRKDMSIIKGFVLNTHGFRKSFFYARLDSSSDLYVVRNLLRGDPYFWGYFSHKRVRLAVAYHRMRLQPDQPVEQESEPSMGEERSISTKNKQVAVDDGNNAVGGLGHLDDNLLCDFLNSQSSGSGTDQADKPELNPDEFFDFGVPPAEPVELRAARMCNGGIYMLTEALKTSHMEACTAQFKAEVTKKEITRLREEAATNSLCERMLEKEVRRAYRRGKKEGVEIMKNHFSQFSNKFGELKKTYQSVGDYREFRGTVGGLYLTQVP